MREIFRAKCVPKSRDMSDRKHTGWSPWMSLLGTDFRTASSWGCWTLVIVADGCEGREVYSPGTIPPKGKIRSDVMISSDSRETDGRNWLDGRRCELRTAIGRKTPRLVIQTLSGFTRKYTRLGLVRRDFCIESKPIFDDFRSSAAVSSEMTSRIAFFFFFFFFASSFLTLCNPRRENEYGP